MEKGKITINIGNLKIDYEGSEEFIKNDFNNIILEKIYTTFKDDIVEKKELSKKPNKRIRIKKKLKKVENISDVLSVLDVKNVNDLIVGTLAYYFFLKGVKIVTNSDLYNIMKKTSIYKKNVGKIKTAISGLIDNRQIIEIGHEKYGLSNKEIKKLEKTLKNHI